MVQHIVMWNLRPDLDKEKTAACMKQQLESLLGQVPGLLAIHVARGFDGYDVALVSQHESRDALALYQQHPAHLRVKAYVHSVIADRVFCDAEL